LQNNLYELELSDFLQQALTSGHAVLISSGIFEVDVELVANGPHR
jgi:hypothetical protein